MFVTTISDNEGSADNSVEPRSRAATGNLKTFPCKQRLFFRTVYNQNDFGHHSHAKRDTTHTLHKAIHLPDGVEILTNIRDVQEQKKQGVSTQNAFSKL